MILTKNIAEKLLTQNINELEIKYPHFAKDLSNSQFQIEKQLDTLYDSNPSDLDVYKYLNQHSISLDEINTVISYRDSKRLSKLIKWLERRESSMLAKSQQIEAVEKRYSTFYNNNFIKFIAENPKWSISDKDKKPVSIPGLKEKLAGVLQGPIPGASQYNAGDMTTLDNLLNILPNASNHAYQLDCKIDHWICLDIEASCPPKLKKRFLSLPYLYGEHSLSGKGIHLYMPLPSNWDKYKAYHNMPKLQEKHKWFEFLLAHWVTFTRNALDKPTSKGDGTLDSATVFAYLTKQVRPAKHIDVNTITKKPDIPNEKLIQLYLSDYHYQKSLGDFYDDESRWEFANAIFLVRSVYDILASRMEFRKTKYTDEQVAYIVYEELKKRLPFREKHDTIRQGMPWLLYTSQTALAHYLDDLDQDTQKH